MWRFVIKVWEMYLDNYDLVVCLTGFTYFHRVFDKEKHYNADLNYFKVHLDTDCFDIEDKLWTYHVIIVFYNKKGESEIFTYVDAATQSMCSGGKKPTNSHKDGIRNCCSKGTGKSQGCTWWYEGFV